MSGQFRRDKPEKIAIEFLSDDELKLPRNKRLLISESISILRVDVSEKCDGTLIWERDLDNVRLSLIGSPAYQQSTIPMSSIMYAYDWAALAINGQLERARPSIKLKHVISSAFSVFHYFVVWCARNGITDLSKIEKADTEKFLAELVKCRSWDTLLETATAYKDLLDQVKASKDPCKEIEKFTSKRLRATANFSFVEHKLSAILGFPVHSSKIPAFFVSGCSEILGGSRVRKHKDGVLPVTDGLLSRRTFRGVLEKINDLGRISDGHTGSLGMKFIPYTNPVRLAKKMIVDSGTSFQNIRLEDTIALLTEARRWVDNYAAPVTTLYRDLGQKLVTLNKTEGKNRRQILFREYFNEVFPAIEQEFGLPHAVYPWGGVGQEIGFVQLVVTLQTACAFLVGVNHGRRHNEVMGEEGHAYGLYRNCLTEFEEDIKRFEVRIYIEKTIRDWVVFPANRGVAQVVNVLESLLEVSESIQTGLTGNAPQMRLTHEGNEKLFQYVSLTKRDAKLPSSYLWHEHSLLFFRLAKVDPENCKGNFHPFRRVFAQIYYYRYENADIRALSQWLGHTSISSALVYVTDPSSRADAERIEKKYREVNAGMSANLREFGREYLNDCLLRLLDGMPSGGGFSKYAIQVFRALALKATFPTDNASRAKELVKWFSERGYEPEPMPHAVCLAGDNNTSRGRGKCYNKKTRNLDKYKATPDLCSGCPHAYTNEGYLDSDQEEITRLRAQAGDESLPTLVRAQAEKAGNVLGRVIAMEHLLQNSNKKKIAEVYENLAVILGGGVK